LAGEQKAPLKLSKFKLNKDKNEIRKKTLYKGKTFYIKGRINKRSCIFKIDTSSDMTLIREGLSS